MITAHNPGGQLASDAANGSAQALLEAELERRGLTWRPAAGGDPSWTHVEASAAVIGMGEADAIALAAEFGQDAIFVLTPAERQVVGCAEKRIVATGWSIEPAAGGDVVTSGPAVEVGTAVCHREEPAELGTGDADGYEEEVKPKQTAPAEAVDKPGSLAGIVVLVDLDDEPERLYVIPESWARSELRSYATLEFARSYRDVLADDDAVQTVLEGLGRCLEDPDEDLEEDLDARELFERRVAEDAPFNAMEFFGDEGWRQWCPGGAESTAQFLEGKAPALWSRFRQPDGGWGIDYDPDRLPGPCGRAADHRRATCPRLRNRPLPGAGQAVLGPRPRSSRPDRRWRMATRGPGEPESPESGR